MIHKLNVFPARSARPMAELARGHAALVFVLACATVVRIGVELAYRPALFFSDSWDYLTMTFKHVPVGILPSRPSGYPLLLRLLTAPGHDVLAVTIAQHLAGLAVGVLVYWILTHFGLRRSIAAAAAAVVLLDSYAMALEQFIMAEAFFTLVLIGALALTVTRRSTPRALLLAGLLLAVACTLRTSALFVVPVWVIYLLWSARDRRRLLSAAIGLCLPLLLYGSWHALNTGGSFNLDEAQGWFLYGRVAQIADCRGAQVPSQTRLLCGISAKTRRSWHPGIWIWSPWSPAEWIFGGNPDAHGGTGRGAKRAARDDHLLQQFSLAIIRAHPLAYAGIVTSDFLSAFDPAVTPASDDDGVTVTFPSSPLWGWLYRRQRNRYLPGYVPHVHWPAPLLRRYQDVFHAPRVLLGLLCALAAIMLLAPALTRGRVRPDRRAEVFLLTGAGVAMLFGSAALVGFVVRYLIPCIPLLVCGGALAATELLRASRVSQSWRRPETRGAQGLAYGTSGGASHMTATAQQGQSAQV